MLVTKTASIVINVSKFTYNILFFLHKNQTVANIVAAKNAVLLQTLATQTFGLGDTPSCNILSLTFFFGYAFLILLFRDITNFNLQSAVYLLMLSDRLECFSDQELISY